jgi:RNA polymerase sigma-70 factor (ECF subfamily)
MNDRSDRQLVRAARGGDRFAFSQLIDRHYPALLGSCRRMLGDAELASDAAQEAVLRAMLGLDHLRAEDRFSPWWIGIGLNVSRGLLSRQRRVVPVELMAEHHHHCRREPVSGPVDPFELLASSEEAEQVHAAIAALPPGQREAVALFYIDGLTNAEAAAELRTRPGAIKTRLHKARGSPRASLKPAYQEDSVPEHTEPLVPMHIAQLRRTTRVSPVSSGTSSFYKARMGTSFRSG